MIMILWLIEPNIDYNLLLPTIKFKNLVVIMIISNSVSCPSFPWNLLVIFSITSITMSNVMINRAAKRGALLP